MPLDLVQLVTNILRREELVKDVPSLDTTRWEVSVVVLECFDFE